MTSPTLEELARRALDGDRGALDQLCRRLQGPLYRLALRMLGHSGDAADACQDVLVQVITHLAQFQGRSQLLTWAYTIAVRHLLRARHSRPEAAVKPEVLAAAINRGLAATLASSTPEGEVHQLEREVRLACTQNMLRCLSREERIAVILGEVLGADDGVGAEISGVTRQAFRQRLARGRAKLRPVLEERCGLRNEANPCRCARQAAAKQQLGPIAATWTSLPVEPDPRMAEAHQALGALRALGQVFAFRPAIAAPAELWEQLQLRFPALLT